MADDEITREPIEKKKAAAATAADSTRDGIVREPITRQAPAAVAEAEPPENAGFTAGNMLHNAKEGLYDLGRGSVQLGKDLLFSEGANERGETQYGLGGLVGMTDKGFHPLDRAGHLVDKYFLSPGKQELGKAKEELSQGNVSEAAGHGLASIVPIAGPWAASIGEQARTGDVGGALSRGGTQVLAGELVPRAAGSALTRATKIGRGLSRLGELGEEGSAAGAPAPAPAPRPLAPIAKEVPRAAAPEEAAPPVTLGTRPASVPGGLRSIRPAEGPVSLASRPGATGEAPAAPRPLAPLPKGPIRAAEPDVYDLGEIGPVAERAPEAPAAGLSPIRVSREMGIRWASSPEGYRVSIPKDVPTEEIPIYAEPKLAQQAEIHEGLKPIGPGRPEPGSSLNIPERGTMEPAQKPGLQPIPRASLSDIVDRATGNKPLERNTPLKEQLTPTKSEAGAETDPIKVKYPDAEVRKFVRANGEALVDAVGGNKELLQQIHDLKNLDIRQAAINAGIDVGTKHVGSKAALGEEQISRQELLTQILQKGIKPADIPELAKPPKEE